MTAMLERFRRHAPVQETRETTGGGESQHMPEEENGNGNGNGDGVREMTDEQFRAAVREEAESLFAAHREEAERDRQELHAAREEIRHSRIREIARGLQEEGHAPALVLKATELMLADSSGEVMLELSQKVEGSDDPVTRKMSATDIILELMTSVPHTALDKDQVHLARRTDPPDVEDKRTTEEKAEALLKELRETAVRLPATV